MTSVRRILTRKLKSRFTTKVVNSAAVGQKWMMSIFSFVATLRVDLANLSFYL
jgi:hypothetical protein